MPFEVVDSIRRAIEDGAERDGVSADTYLHRLLLADSLRRHAAWSAEHHGLDEWGAQEADAAAAARRS